MNLKNIQSCQRCSLCPTHQDDQNHVCMPLENQGKEFTG